MNKFKFLGVLITALLMFSGFGLSAQDYVSNNQAESLVKSAIKSQKISDNNQGPAGLSTASGLKQTSGEKVARLKVYYGKTLLDFFKRNIPVSDALAKTSATISANYNDDIVFKKVDEFYKNLLSN